MNFEILNKDSRYLPYIENIKKYISNDKKILVVGANHKDVIIFSALGYKNVIFSNLFLDDFKKDMLENKEYMKTFEDINKQEINMTKIPFEDNSFDFCTTSASLHHCSKPHLALLEMYRVSKKGVVFIEGRDSILSKLLTKLGVLEEYEYSSIDEAQAQNKGGMDGTTIPNYVYKWTEREVEKLIKSYKPTKEHIYKYNYYFTNDNLANIRNKKFLNSLLNLFSIIFKVFFKIFKKQSNLMSVVIIKQYS
jgi:ubiquinone/menaquinone biosynthesis C-methylase UbiE